VKTDNELIYENYNNIVNSQGVTSDQESAMDTLQTALDAAGFEPSVGTFADASNIIISGLRAATTKERDARKKHLINMGISAVSLIPFADVIKILKLRKLGKAPTKIAIAGSRKIKSAATLKKSQMDRFDSDELE
jgi:hypothetical protein